MPSFFSGLLTSFSLIATHVPSGWGIVSGVCGSSHSFFRRGTPFTHCHSSIYQKHFWGSSNLPVACISPAQSYVADCTDASNSLSVGWPFAICSKLESSMYRTTANINASVDPALTNSIPFPCLRYTFIIKVLTARKPYGAAPFPCPRPIDRSHLVPSNDVSLCPNAVFKNHCIVSRMYSIIATMSFHCIVAVGQVHTLYCTCPMQGVSNVTKESWCKDSMRCLQPPFCKLLCWDYALREGLIHHLCGFWVAEWLNECLGFPRYWVQTLLK